MRSAQASPLVLINSGSFSFSPSPMQHAGLLFYSTTWNWYSPQTDPFTVHPPPVTVAKAPHVSYWCCLQPNLIVKIPFESESLSCNMSNKLFFNFFYGCVHQLFIWPLQVFLLILKSLFRGIQPPRSKTFPQNNFILSQNLPSFYLLLKSSTETLPDATVHLFFSVR